VEAITDKLSEVTGLAEQLDASLCGMQNGASIKRILDGSATTTPQEWCATLKTSCKTLSAEDSKSEDDFVTASECTCTPSRSSSFHTASECGGASPWWEVDRMSDVGTDDSAKERRTKEDGGSDQTSSQSETERAVVRTVTEVTTDVVIHEVVEKTHLKLSHGDSSGVTSYLLTTETVRSGVAEEKPKPATDTANPIDPDSQLLNQMKEVRQLEDRTHGDPRHCYHQHITRHAVKGIL
jgi:hypothetical protein